MPLGIIWYGNERMELVDLYETVLKKVNIQVMQNWFKMYCLKGSHDKKHEVLKLRTLWLMHC